VSELPENLRAALGSMTREEEDAILASFLAQAQQRFDFASLEELIVSPEGFALVDATPLQRAIFRMAQGLDPGEYRDHPAVLEALGIASPDQIPVFNGPPRDLFVLAGIRAAKSTLLAAGAIWAAQTIDCTGLLDGEVPRFPILSLSKDNAAIVVGHLLGALQKPRLKHLRIPEPKAAGERWAEILKEGSSDSIFSVHLWHPTGRPIEICVVAGKRAGASVISRWLAGLGLDEAPRMLGSDDAVVNYDDSKRGARGRLRKGAQFWSIGSPHQPYGPVFDEVTEHWGEPTPDKVIFKARGPLMNPTWFTDELCSRMKKEDPVAYQTDVLAEFADALETLYPQSVITASTRKAPMHLPYVRGRDYIARIDPATRSNAWTLVIAAREGRKKKVVYHRQWMGTTIEPLSPKMVLREIREDVAVYGLDWCYSDQWSADAIKDLAQDVVNEDGQPWPLAIVIEEWTTRERANVYMSLAEAMKAGDIELPPDAQLHKDLKLTKKKATDKGPSIQLAKTTDGRHCDYAPALAGAMKRWLDEDAPIVPQRGEPGYDKHYERKLEEAEEEALRVKQAEQWWERDPFERSGEFDA
jgi:hypothetical protein